MIQDHLITQDFFHRWREHPSTAGVIISTHNTLKEEVVALKKNEFNRKSELSKIVSRVKALESRKCILPSHLHLRHLF